MNFHSANNADWFYEYTTQLWNHSDIGQFVQQQMVWKEHGYL